MSKKRHSKEKFEPKIGFEIRIDKNSSLSLSDFEIEGKPPQSISFFSESDNFKAESKEESKEQINESNPAANESRGLNNAFFEEPSSSSFSVNDAINFFKKDDENTAIGAKEHIEPNQDETPLDSSEVNEIIISKIDNNEEVKEQKPQAILKKEESREKGKPQNHCCKCKACLVF